MKDSAEDTKEIKIDSLVLYEEFRLIEKNETQVNLKWKGAHLLLFVLAFIFGVMCTFCLNVLAYMFERRCVLAPELLALEASAHVLILDFLPKEYSEDYVLPMDFLRIQWSDENVCSLPTFVPICSAIFGLIWTTLFIMCSQGGQTHGLHRPWRLMLPVLVFSLAMGGLCAHVAAVTHSGLDQLCRTIGQFTGSEDCSYIMNVATLPYEGRIRGVYQAVRFTIFTAWTHTACWLLAAALVVVRVLFVVDFQMVRIRVELKGDVDSMLERHERQLRSETLDPGIAYDSKRRRWITIKLPEATQTSKYNADKDDSATSRDRETDVIFQSNMSQKASSYLDTNASTTDTKIIMYFKIKGMLNDLFDSIPLRQSSVELNQQSLENPSGSPVDPPSHRDRQSTDKPAYLDSVRDTSKGTSPENLSDDLNRLDAERHVSFNPKQEERQHTEKATSTSSAGARDKDKSQEKNAGVQTSTDKAATTETATATTTLVSGSDDSYGSIQKLFKPDKNIKEKKE